MHKTRLALFAVLALGIGLTVMSAVYLSSFLAILGVGIVFWGAVLLYTVPTNQVPISVLSASAAANAGNTEKILTELNLAEKGRYLPPKYLDDRESSLVFIPERLYQRLPRISETTDEKLRFNNRAGLFLTPPGAGLSKLFEQALGVSFTKIDLACMRENFPKILTQGMKLAETAKIQTQNDKITVEITGSALIDVCEETRKSPRTHKAVGCLLSSAIACALAKVTGKAIIIEEETLFSDKKTLQIEYRILGD